MFSFAGKTFVLFRHYDQISRQNGAKSQRIEQTNWKKITDGMHVAGRASELRNLFHGRNGDA
jgi:hypothetical protein